MPKIKIGTNKNIAPVESFRQKLLMITAIFIVFAMLFGAWTLLVNTFAQKKVELKLDYINCTILDELNNQRIEKLMARCPKGIENADPSTKEQLALWMKKKERLKIRIETLEKAGIGLEIGE